MTCHFAGRDRPRMLRTHEYGCDTATCLGCVPCPERHCRVCGMAHADGTCAECLAETRAALRGIGQLCDSLPEEVEHRGINGEAMMLLGPAADPEARGHLEASIAAGRIPADYLEHADGERHPLFVLGTWDMVVRDALEHDEPAEKLTIATAIDYLDRQLTYLAGFEHLPFEDMARDLRDCQSHIESVLHAGEQVEKGAPCLTCHRAVTLTTDARGQRIARCERCRRDLTENEYRLAVRAGYMAHADRLNIDDMAERAKVPAGTLRRWASVQRGETEPRLRSCGIGPDGRKVYRVTAVESLRDQMRTASA